MSKAWKGGSTRAWREKRARVLARDGYRCRVQVAGVCVGFSVPMHVHHLDGKRNGDNESRLVASCMPCNLHIGQPKRAMADPPCKAVTQW